MRLVAFVVLAVLSAASTPAQSVPAAIFTDPPVDAAHPAKMTVLLRGRTDRWPHPRAVERFGSQLCPSTQSRVQGHFG